MIAVVHVHTCAGCRKQLSQHKQQGRLIAALAGAAAHLRLISSQQGRLDDGLRRSPGLWRLLNRTGPAFNTPVSTCKADSELSACSEATALLSLLFVATCGDGLGGASRGPLKKDSKLMPCSWLAAAAGAGLGVGSAWGACAALGASAGTGAGPDPSGGGGGGLRDLSGSAGVGSICAPHPQAHSQRISSGIVPAWRAGAAARASVAMGAAISRGGGLAGFNGSAGRRSACT